MGECFVGVNVDQVFWGGVEEVGVVVVIGEQLGVGMLQMQVFDDLLWFDVVERLGLGVGQYDFVEVFLVDIVYCVVYFGFLLFVFLC